MQLNQPCYYTLCKRMIETQISDLIPGSISSPEPEADPEVKAPEEAEQPTTNVEEESTAGSDTAAPVEVSSL